MFCKGADSIIEPLLSSENQPEKVGVICTRDHWTGIDLSQAATIQIDKLMQTMKHCQEMASLGTCVQRFWESRALRVSVCKSQRHRVCLLQLAI